jgi:hypothetical protein
MQNIVRAAVCGIHISLGTKPCLMIVRLPC